MNYKVLYRKYRPDDFDNIIGQNYIIKTLKNSIINKNISHAYIFSGPRGTGKTSTAKVFSKAINCSQSTDGSPCGNCEFCKNFIENPDIIEIDAASNNGVDEIRSLIDNIKLTPTNGKYKVYIIDEVHMLTTSAFNALLLTLEEPPSHAIFILATTNIENVPITILSRCQRYDFQKIKVEDIVERLKKVCKYENISYDEDALIEISYLSEGGMRDALSLLDQLSKNNQQITVDLVEKQVKTISNKVINDLLDSIEKNNIENFFELINEFRVKSLDYKTLIKKMIDICSKKAKNIKKERRYKRLTFNDYKKLVFELTELLNKININVDPYTLLELVILDFFENENNIQEKTKINVEISKTEFNKEQNIEINNEQENDYPKEKNNSEIENMINVRINNCFVNAQKTYLEEMKKEVNSYLDSSNISGKIKAVLLDTLLVASSDKYMIFSCENNHVMDNANKLITEIENDIKKIIDKDMRIIFISQDRWNIEKQKYIENIKNKIKYTIIEEEIPDNNEECIINDVFDLSKVEII